MATGNDVEIEAGISSDEIGQPLICQPCKEEGETLAAFGHCVNCREYLCQKCYNGHLIPSLTKRHVLEILVNEHTIEVKATSKYSCQHHGHKNIEYHCPTHYFLGCHVCFFQNHRNCKDVVYIPEAAKTERVSDDLHKFYENIGDITSKCEEFLSEIKQAKQTIAMNQKEALSALENFKQDIIDLINKLEQTLVDDIDKLHSEETVRMAELSLKCESLSKETRDISTSVEKKHNEEQNCELYIELVTSKNKVVGIEDQVRDIERRKGTKKILFKENKELVVLLKSLRELGIVGCNTCKTIEKIDYKGSVNCKSVKDTSKCDIRGMVSLHGSKLLVSDNENSVKLFDTKQDKLVSELKFSNSSYGLCIIDDSLVAVAVPDDKKIILLNTDPILAVEREIYVKEKPWGIGYLDGNFVVSFVSNKVIVMDMQGVVLATYVTGANGQALFAAPYHVAIHPDNKLIYISNYRSNTVVCMTLDGAIVATYDDKELVKPKQITFDSSGKVYVCGEESNNVHQITKDCKRAKVILNKSDGLDFPIAICHQEEHGLFYIDHYNSSTLKVYNVDYSYH